VKASLRELGINPVKGKGVLIKPNLNTADTSPGATYNDTLVALVEELWAMGAKSISLGERSYPPTREVLEEKGISSLMKPLNAEIIHFDDLPQKDWVEVIPRDSHWKKGFRVARAVELGLGASSPEAIELVAADEKSRVIRDQIGQVL
jgi:uncharacterized protein (DUF362 family)